MTTLTKRGTDQPPVVTRADRERAFARLFAVLLYSEDERKREAARNALKLWLQLRQDCKERKSA